jgi:chemotaxis protein MotB
VKPPDGDPGDGETEDPAEGGAASMTDDEIEAQAKEIERARLEELKKQLEEAIEQSPSLAAFKEQLLLDITPEGLRIQIVDQQNRPMFDSGSFRLQSYTINILNELAPYLQGVPNRLSITGHTDTTPFGGGDTGYTNWELSADRANAARRALVSGGVSMEKMARVVGVSDSVLFDKENPTNPINRRISIIVMNKATEDAALGRNDDPADADAAAETPPGRRTLQPSSRPAAGSPRSMACRFITVVAAICVSASRVRNPWWAVTTTFGNVSRRANTSSSMPRSERSRSNRPASSS